jgi:predicted MFS family arabinose efflux permease
VLFYIASIIGGAVWGIASGGLVNRLMERVPDDDRPAHMALHNLALSLGILIGSVLGPALAEWLGLRNALYLSALLRLLAGLLLAAWA